MQKEGDVKALGDAGGAKREQFRREVVEWESRFLAANEVVATNQGWEFLLQLNTLHQRGSDAFLAEGAGTAIDYFEACEGDAGCALGGDGLGDDLEEARVGDEACGVGFDEGVAGEVGPDLGVLDVVADEILDACVCVGAECGFVAEKAFEHAGAGAEAEPDAVEVRWWEEVGEGALGTDFAVVWDIPYTSSSVKSSLEASHSSAASSPPGYSKRNLS